MGSKKGTIISLCDLTGVMVMPWIEAGYDAILVDPKHPEGVTLESRGSATITRVGHVVDHAVGL